MNRLSIIEIIYRSALTEGFAHRSLADLARPCGLTRGALSHYFNTSKDSIQTELGRELVHYAREVRARYLLHPTKAFAGGLASRRIFFSRQMAHYLEDIHKGLRTSSWSCPAFQLEQELRHLSPIAATDIPYHDLLKQLWLGYKDFPAFSPDGPQLERFFSGPYVANREAVMDFFSPKKKALAKN